MDLAELLRATGRRWYVLVGGAVVIVALVLVTLRVVPLTYDVKSSILLLPPATSVAETGGNPFLNLGGLDVVAGVLAESLSDSESVATIVPEGTDAEYTVQKHLSVSGSVLQVAVMDASPEKAFATLHAVEALAAARLSQLQQATGASAESEVQLMVITQNTIAEPNLSALLRSLILVVAAGLVLTLLFAVSVDALARRKQELAAQRHGDASGVPVGARATRPSAAVSARARHGVPEGVTRS
jgi:hypothetical protein